MARNHSRLGLLSLGFILAASMLSAFSAAPPADPEPVGRAHSGASASAAPSKHAYLGAASCSAVGCHGGSESKPGDASAYRMWLTRDPHARAFAVLQDERSEHIAASLAGASGPVIPPTEDARCLNCHARQDSASALASTTLARAEGVSCESCHGPAEHWVDAHWRDWKTHAVSAQDKLRLGMTDTKDAATRAQACAQCHVGGRGRDVNHDLIAAGHPRLTFEYSAFMANLPRHWDAADDVQGGPERVTNDWAIGQLASAQAALDLLAWRTETGDSRRDADPPWPELAEYACFSCHHDLGGSAGSTRPTERKANAGALRWGTWYFALAPHVGAAASSRPDAPLALLERAISRPAPARDAVHRLACAARDEFGERLDRLRANHGFTPRDQRALIAHAVRPTVDRHSSDWDRDAQLYLAASALQQSQTRSGTHASNAAESALGSMLELLHFPPGFDSPEARAKPASGTFPDAVQRFLDATDAKLGRAP